MNTPKPLPWEYDTRPDCSDVSYMSKSIEQQIKEGYQSERDPNDIPLKQPGAKADAGKSPVMQGVLQYFPRALLEVGRVSERGAQKYSWRGWEHVPNGPLRYGDALSRHIILEGIEGPYDKDTGLLHAAQSAWNALARLELILRESESDHGTT